MTNEMKRTDDDDARVIIDEPRKLRGLVIEAMQAVIEGRITVMQGNSIASLATEVHKSIRLEWDMHCYARTMRLEESRIIEVDDDHS